MQQKKIIEELISISTDAGKAILNVYNSNFSFEVKEDSSPLTEADMLSNKIICERLEKLTPEIPIISEEKCNVSYETRKNWNRFWLIDPLDGTKEFINKNGEFTVNIALVEDNIPILGVIHIPVKNDTYWGCSKLGSFIYRDGKDDKKISVNKSNNESKVIVASRSHPSEGFETFIRKYKEPNIIKRGSSIKFCLIASGVADIYPRHGKTSEWDIAAGAAIVMHAGGFVVDFQGQELLYNKGESFIVDGFIASNLKI